MTRGGTNIGVGVLGDLPESRARPPALFASPPDHLSSFIAFSSLDKRPQTLF
jgi:hypothetical protein